MNTTEQLIIDILSIAKCDTNDNGFFIITNRNELRGKFNLSNSFLNTLDVYVDWIFSQGYCIGFNERGLEEKS